MSGLENHFTIIESVVSQFEEMSEMIRRSINCTMDIARERIETDSDVTENQLSSVKKTMIGYLDLQKNVINFQRSFEDVKEQTLSSNELPEDLDKVLIRDYNMRSAKDDESRSEDSPYYRQLLELIAEGLGDGDEETLPLITTTDDLEMTETKIIPLDPISRHEIGDPVFNKVCKHVYERENILNYIKSKQGTAKCPMVGCKNEVFVTPRGLQDHLELRRFINRKKNGLANF